MRSRELDLIILIGPFPTRDVLWFYTVNCSQCSSQVATILVQYYKPFTQLKAVRSEGRIQWKERGMTDWIRGMPAQIEKFPKTWIKTYGFILLDLAKHPINVCVLKRGTENQNYVQNLETVNWTDKSQKNLIWTMLATYLASSRAIHWLQRITELVSDLRERFFATFWKFWVFRRFSHSVIGNSRTL